MKRTLAYLAGALALIPLALFVRSFSSAPLPKPKPYSGPLPDASPPKELALFALPTGVIHSRAAYGYRGGSFFDRRDFSMTGTLVKHPKGDLLIDTGFGRKIDDQFPTMPFYFRAVTFYTVWRPALDQMIAADYDPRSLRAILLTHSHWDHVSGVCDFPGVPVRVTREEREFLRQNDPMNLCRLFNGVRYEEYGFEDEPYFGFPKSHDVYRDGSIVIVPSPGHTPGSVIIFVTLYNGARYAFVGDLVWQLEGIAQREERPWITRSMADVDAASTRENILRIVAIKERFPEMIVVPAHDLHAFAEMPAL